MRCATNLNKIIENFLMSMRNAHFYRQIKVREVSLVAMNITVAGEIRPQISIRE